MFDVKVRTSLAVIGTRSYTKAAQKLNLARPTVGHQIHMLESEFDIRTLYKDKNELRLTSQDKILIQYTRRVAAVYSNAWQAIENSGTKTSHLNVGITPTADETIIPQVLATLCDENPGIHINIGVNTTQRIYTRLKAYKLDLAAVEGAVPDDVLVAITLGTDYLCLVVSPIHRLVRAKTVSPRGIRHEKLILGSQSASTRQLSEKHLGARNMSLSEFNVTMELDNASIIKELVNMDLGIAIIAKSVCRKELASGRPAIIPIENSTMMHQINMVYQKDFIRPELIDNIRLVYEHLKTK